MAQKQSISLDLSKASPSHQLKQLDAYMDNPMMILASSSSEQTETYTQQISDLKEQLQIERHTKMMIEAASYKETKR